MGIPMNAAAKAAELVDCVAAPSKPPFEPLKRNEQLVYDALCQSETPLKAYDLLDALQDHGLRAPMTIYRALDALTAKGIVRKIESLNAFVTVHPAPEGQARAFLICKDCMQAKEIALDEDQLAALFSPIQVDAEDVRIEAFSGCHEVCGRLRKDA